jgi:hypothetical protein
MIRFGEESPEDQRIVTEPLSSVENTLKLVEDQRVAIDGSSLIEMHHAAEGDLRARVARDPRSSKEVGDPWTEIAKAQDRFRALYLRYRMLEANAGSGSTLFRYAIKLVQAGKERTLPSGQRLPEYADDSLADMRASLLSNISVNRSLDALFFEFWLAKTFEDLGPDDHAVRAMLGTRSADVVAADAMKRTRLTDPAYRASLWDGGDAAVRTSDDPLIKLALILDPAARAIRKRWEAEVTGPTNQAMVRIVIAKRSVYGGSLYPNGDRTPRLSYGRVSGHADAGETVPAFTTIGGLYRHATGAEPCAFLSVGSMLAMASMPTWF